jgi:hypothetical protein
MDVATLRMIERILSVCVGGFSIYLGFHLFKIIPHGDKGDGKFVFPGGSVHLTRTGPGIFFALFGCAIIFWSFSHPISVPVMKTNDPMSISDNNKPEKPVVTPIAFLGTASSLEEKEKTLTILIQNLNRIKTGIKDTTLIDKAASINTIERIKFLLIHSMVDDSIRPEFENFRMTILAEPNHKFGEQWQKWADIYNKM